jgi:hypothetical protein
VLQYTTASWPQAGWFERVIAGQQQRQQMRESKPPFVLPRSHFSASTGSPSWHRCPLCSPPHATAKRLLNTHSWSLLGKRETKGGCRKVARCLIPASSNRSLQARAHQFLTWRALGGACLLRAATSEAGVGDSIVVRISCLAHGWLCYLEPFGQASGVCC